MFQFLFGRRHRVIERQMAMLGHRLGIPATRPKGGWQPFMENFPHIEGKLMGRTFYFKSYRKGSGKNKNYYTEFTMSVANRYEYTLTLYKERIWNKLGKAIGIKDIEIGDPPFDKNFMIKSNDDYFAQEVLKDKHTKDYFQMILPGMHGEFVFKGEELSFKQRGLMLNERDRIQIEHTIEVALVLANKIEQFADERDPTKW